MKKCTNCGIELTKDNSNRAFRTTNSENVCTICYNKRARKYLRNIKIKIFNLLGNKCSNPFNLNHGDFLADPRCLQIDHVNGGGSEEKRQSRKSEKNNKSRSNWNYYKNILTKLESGSKDYQLLCANCNWIKRNINKEDGS